MIHRRNRKIQIFVDADACPVVAIIEKIAKENSVLVTLLCDTKHVLSSTYSEVVVVGAGAETGSLFAGSKSELISGALSCAVKFSYRHSEKLSRSILDKQFGSVAK